DLAVIKRVGLGITVANASSTLTAQAVMRTNKSGGDGAVREVAEFLLRAQGKLDRLLERYH
ncbi:phenylphosphate carboxylase subunit delta, partial [bacterium]|nr:phenylphosphate carboxylase subunit delta [bacterium]